MRGGEHARRCIRAPRRRWRGARGARGKAIVLLNRRGWSNFLSCRSCGRVWSCPHCDVALVLHRAGGFLACHHCGHREPRARSAAPPAPRCRSRATAPAPSAWQHELAAVLDDGGFPIFRLDADVVAGAGAAGRCTRQRSSALRLPTCRAASARCCAASRRPTRGVLIGTQMVAKGHDFPDVTLGVVLDADATLRFPDFRAEERTFALIAQLAGRVGRGGEGRVLVQTIAPEARAIAHAARHDSDGFLAGELQRREALRYPPFSHLIRVVCSAERTPTAPRGGGGRARALRRAGGASQRADGRTARRCSARRRCFACAGASARCSSSRRRERARAVRAVGEAVQRGRRRARAPRRQLQRRRRSAVAGSPPSGSLPPDGAARRA